MTNNLQNYVPTAERAAQIVERVLFGRGLQPPARWVMTEREGRVWLFGILPPLAKVQPYFTNDLFHSLSTALGGRPVFPSNHTGVRIAVLLTGTPRLPETVEIPNRALSELLQPDSFAFGVGVRGLIQSHATEWINMLVAGGQGSGKSTFLRLFAHTARTHGWKLYLADPDLNSFSEAWNGVAEMSVASSPEEVYGMLGRVLGEIERRIQTFQEYAAQNGGVPPRDIDEFNKANPGQKMARIGLVMDEANSYLGDKEILALLTEIARRGRKWGCHMVLAGHNWRANDVPRELSAMLPTRLCLRVADNTSGKVVLGSEAWGRQVMKITKKGRGVLLLMGRYQPLQAFYVSPERELEWLGTQPIAPLLTPLQAEMVRLAQEELDGEFAIDKLTERMGGRATRWAIRQTAQEWQLKGWLTPPADATSARKVTPQLAKLARLGGAPRTGAQAA